MSDEEKVSMTTGELKALMTQMSTLTKQVTELTAKKADTPTGGARARREDKSSDHTIMFIDGKPVVGMVNKGTTNSPVKLYDIPDPLDKNKSIMGVDLQIKDLKSGEVEVIAGLNFLEFIQEGERRKCAVIRPIERKWYLDEGTVEQQEVKEYSMEGKGVDVNLEVTGVERLYVMDIDGEEVEIHEDYVNMASAAPRREKTFE